MCYNYIQEGRDEMMKKLLFILLLIVSPLIAIIWLLVRIFGATGKKRWDKCVYGIVNWFQCCQKQCWSVIKKKSWLMNNNMLLLTYKC